ncbi:hypothetical protein N599_19870 [Saccharopolyspora erythraea D]|nr:hypothetical protein N599_19870 [Saccharopolyspora erythraea D]
MPMSTDTTETTPLAIVAVIDASVPKPHLRLLNKKGAQGLAQ